MKLPQQMERVYGTGLRKITFGRNKKYDQTVARQVESATIKSRSMFRKTQNTGAFKDLNERMSKKHIREIAKEFGVEIEGLSLNIDFNEELLRIPLAGRADPENLGGITFSLIRLGVKRNW